MNEEGDWTVDINEDGSGVVMAFSHLGEDGVESFDTAMPFENAKDFAQAIITLCEENNE